jgi:hypothetical protein
LARPVEPFSTGPVNLPFWMVCNRSSFRAKILPPLFRQSKSPSELSPSSSPPWPETRGQCYWSPDNKTKVPFKQKVSGLIRCFSKEDAQNAKSLSRCSQLFHHTYLLVKSFML